MCRKIILFIVSIVLSLSFGDCVYSAEKKKNKLAVKQEKSNKQKTKRIPELRRCKRKFGRFKKFINVIYKKIYKDSRFPEGKLGKLILENWSLGNSGEELLRYNVLPFLDHKERSNLREVCKYFKELVEEEWDNGLKNFSTEDLKTYLKGAVESGYTEVVKALCANKKLGEVIAASEDKYQCEFSFDCGLHESIRLEKELKQKKEFVKKEASELTEIFELAVKKGDEKIIRMLLEKQQIREALTYAYPYAFFNEGSSRCSVTEDFFKERGSNNRVVKCLIQKDRVIWVTISDNGCVELFEVMFDNDDISKTFQEYCQNIEALEKKYPNDCRKRKIIETLGGDFSFAYMLRDVDLTNKRVRSFTLGDDFVMAVHSDEHKKVTYMACKDVSCSDDTCIAKILEHASEKDCKTAVEFLLQKKDELGINDPNKQRAIFFALASGAKRVLPLFGMQEDVDAIKLFESFLDKKEVYGITKQDIARAFTASLSNGNKEISDKLLGMFKDDIFSYLYKEDEHVLKVFHFAIQQKRLDIMQMLVDDEKTLKSVKSIFVKYPRWELNEEEWDMSLFLMQNKDRLGLTADSAQYVLEDAVKSSSKRIVELLLENFDHSKEHLQKVFDASDDAEIRALLKDKMSE